MKKGFQYIFVAACIAAGLAAVFFFIRERIDFADAAKPLSSRQVIAGAQEQFAGQGSASSRKSSEPIAHIEAANGEVILAVLNLDNGQNEVQQQILTVRKQNSAICIVVADYLTEKRSWVRSFEGETLVSKLTTFSLQVVDIIGDQNPAIICSGIDDSNHQTITIFRRAKNASPGSYSVILKTSADSIQIQENSRSDNYQMGEATHESWPVFALSEDAESQNALDQIRTVYSWDNSKATFIVSKIEHLPGVAVGRTFLEKILTGSEKDFETYLDGSWQKENSGSDQNPQGIAFDKENSEIRFYDGDAVEVYSWAASQATRYGVYIRAKNSNLDNLFRVIDAELAGPELVSIRVFEDQRVRSDPNRRWDGVFKKVNTAQSIAAKTGSPQALQSLQGSFLGTSGVRLTLVGKRYTYSDFSHKESGLFSIYPIGNSMILALSGEGQSANKNTVKTFRIESASVDANKNLSTKPILVPVRIMIDGELSLGSDSLTMSGALTEGYASSAVRE